MRVKIKCMTATGQFIGMSFFTLSPSIEAVISELSDEAALKVLEDKYVTDFALQCYRLSGMSEDIHTEIDLLPA